MNYKLSDICNYGRDKIDSSSLTSSTYISTENMLPNLGGVTLASSMPTISSVSRFKNGDILLSNIRPYFQKMIFADFDGGCSNDVLVLRADEKCILPEYLYYSLAHKNFFDYVTKTGKGTKMPRGDKAAIMKYEINVPEVYIQQKIIKILSSIDKKIKNNNRTNDNLHEMCLTIYRDLINKADAEKDLLKNHARCVLGGTPSRAKPEYWNGNINWINSGEINRFRILEPSETITDLGLKKTSTTLLPIGTTVLAITGATLGQVSRLEIESCANQSVIGVIPDDSLTNEFVYLNILENINDIIGRQTGGAQQHINKNDVETYEIIIPEPEKIAKFDKEIKPIFGQIRNNCLENERLTKLRDTLLPELLNGKIDISNIDI